MNPGGLLLGVVNIAIVVVGWLLVGAVIVMLAKAFGYAIDWNVQKLYLLLVLLIAVYMLVALMLGLPTWRVVQHDFPPIGGPIPPPTTQIIRPEVDG